MNKKQREKKDVIVIKGCPIKRVLCVLGRESNQLGTHKWRRGSRTSGGGGYTIRPSIWKGRENNGRRKITQRHEYLNDGATFFLLLCQSSKEKKNLRKTFFFLGLFVCSLDLFLSTSIAYLSGRSSWRTLEERPNQLAGIKIVADRSSKRIEMVICL